MKPAKPLILFICLLTAFLKCYSQQVDSVLVLKAFRQGMWIDPKTGKKNDFALCGDDLSTDSSHFLSIVSGCERNVHLLLGRYTFTNDTILVSPFDFIHEDPFAAIYKVKSNKETQTIKFLSADYKPLNGGDSSWMVRCFRRKKQTLLDCSVNGIVAAYRDQYDGIELLQLSKIFGSPVVMFLDRQFDYVVIVNLPGPPLKRFITGAVAVKGKGFIAKDSLYFGGSPDGFKITSHSGNSR